MALSAAATAHLAKLKARLAVAEANYEAAFVEQYSIAGRSKKMPSLDTIQKIIDSLEAQIFRLENNDGSTAVRPSFIPSGYTS